jgi:hypothetical protein
VWDDIQLAEDAVLNEVTDAYLARNPPLFAP